MSGGGPAGGLTRTVYCHQECGRVFSGSYRDVMAQCRLHARYCHFMGETYPQIANTPMSPYLHARKGRNSSDWNTSGVLTIQDNVVSRSGTAVGGGSSRVSKPAPAPEPAPEPACWCEQCECVFLPCTAELCKCKEPAPEPAGKR